QLTISGGGSASPSLIQLPGAYAATDPGIKVDIYQSLATYIAPGPTVYGGFTKSAGATCAGVETGTATGPVYEGGGGAAPTTNVGAGPTTAVPTTAAPTTMATSVVPTTGGAAPTSTAAPAQPTGEISRLGLAPLWVCHPSARQGHAARNMRVTAVTVTARLASKQDIHRIVSYRLVSSTYHHPPPTIHHPPTIAQHPRPAPSSTSTHHQHGAAQQIRACHPPVPPPVSMQRASSACGCDAVMGARRTAGWSGYSILTYTTRILSYTISTLLPPPTTHHTFLPSYLPSSDPRGQLLHWPTITRTLPTTASAIPHHSPLNHINQLPPTPPQLASHRRGAQALAKNPLSPTPTTDADADTEATQETKRPHETIPDAALTTTNKPNNPLGLANAMPACTSDLATTSPTTPPHAHAQLDTPRACTRVAAAASQPARQKQATHTAAARQRRRTTRVTGPGPATAREQGI
ncbi:hypothetical protein V499_09135, partial [Pseudogymnoascus sp. VKM F-103]